MTFASFSLVVLVGLAGALGAVCRYILGRFVAERVNAKFPLSTFCINLSGAFVIGLLFALTSRKLVSSTLQVILATGFLGGYTTFSTMSWESMQLVRGGSTRGGLLYLGGSMLLGLLAATLGLMLGGWL